MTAYFLANGGSDGASGLSSLLPWQTVAKWVSSTTTGDTINLNRGDQWREFANPLPTGQTIQAYGSGTLPEITAFDVVSGTWTSTTPTNTWSIAWTPSLGTVTAVRVNGTLYPNAASQAALVAGQFFWAANVLYLCIVGGSASMTGFTIEANGNRAQALTPGNGKGSYSFSNIWMSGGTNVTCLMQTQATPSTWTSCKFSDGGITTGVGLLYFAAVGVAGHTVTDCEFRNGICDHLYAADSPSCTVSYCTFVNFYGSLSDHIQMSGSSGGSGGWEGHHNYHYVQPNSGSSKGCVVLSSTTSVGGTNFHDNFFDGGNYAFSFGNSADTGNDNFTIDRNIAVNQANASSVGSYGIGCACTGTRYTYNVSLNSAFHGFNFFNSKARTGLKIYQNTVYGAANRAFSSPAGNTMTGTIEDNIWHAAPAQTDYRTIMASTGFTSDYNDIPGEQANYMFINATGYATLALAQGSGQETHSINGTPIFRRENQSGIYGQTSNPVTASWGSVVPMPTSPTVGVGLRVAGVNDWLSNPPDMGAFPLVLNVMQGSVGRPFQVIRVRW